ncbi:MAG: pyrroline-5-carboxylate reductase, partial [Endozoicomonas sp.]
MKKTTIAFIGTGSMATSILAGLVRNGWPEGNIIATARSEETLSNIRQQYDVQTTRDNQQATRQADVVMLCVKPQMMKSVLTELTPTLKTGTLLISVAAGITMGSLEQWSGNSHAIVRAMPNTPSMVQCGASGLFANPQATESQKSLTQTIFSAIGLAEWVEQEALIDAVIAVSGSGPAYYFLFMEAMKMVGTELGLPPEAAEKLTLQTALGAARMASE